MNIFKLPDSGEGLQEAEKQIAKRIEDPQPTDLQRIYVSLSRKDLKRKRRMWVVSLVVGLVIMVYLSVIATIMFYQKLNGI